MKKARPTPALILAPLMMVLTSMQTSFSYANADNLTWLNKNVSAAKKICKGSSRKDFFNVFAPAAGKLAVPPRYCVKSCASLEVEATFADDAKDNANSQVTSISKLYLSQPMGLRQINEQEHWLLQLLEKTRSIKPGITRSQLLHTFDEEAGLQTIPASRYVLKDCPLVKIDITFNQAKSGSNTGTDKDPTIKAVSSVYVDLPICD
jgi:hypothetical protein